jgi:hypothetical protein
MAHDYGAVMVLARVAVMDEPVRRFRRGLGASSWAVRPFLRRLDDLGGLAACSAREMGHNAFGTFDQLVLKHFPRHAHDGPQVDALEARAPALEGDNTCRHGKTRPR